MPLHEGVLRYQERNTALADTLCILGDHVVTHNLDVTTVAFQQVFTHKVCLRVECNAMVYQRMFFKELFQNGIVTFALFVE